MAATDQATLSRPFNDLRARAHLLAKQMPELLVEAKRAAQTITYGTHGRRRAGTGETFWQFRQFQDSDTATLVDWRRSASSDHLFVREREWEAAHTVWVWTDISPSMSFVSELADETKLERAIIMALAMIDLLSRGGERVGLLGLLPPNIGQRVLDRCAITLAKQLQQPNPEHSLPTKGPLQAHAECLLISDFLEPAEHLINRFQHIAKQGVRGHLIQVLDPAEESFPYQGRTEFMDIENNRSFLSERAETMRDEYIARLQEHRAELKKAIQKMQWSFMVHHTDRPIEETLLSLHAKLSGLDHNYRFRKGKKRAKQTGIFSNSTQGRNSL